MLLELKYVCMCLNSFCIHSALYGTTEKIALCLILQLNGQQHMDPGFFSLLRLQCAFPFPPATPTLCDIVIPFNTHTERHLKRREKTKRHKQVKCLCCEGHSDVPLSAELRLGPLTHVMKTWKCNAIPFVPMWNTHTASEYWSTERQLGICYKWWNRNVLRLPEIGFFFLWHINKSF